MTTKEVKGAPVRILVLDVLKPHKPNILEFGKVICSEKTVEDVNISVYAVDEKTESLKIVLEGKDINYDNIEELIKSHGAVIHSMDKVVLGRKRIIEVPESPERITVERG